MGLTISHIFWRFFRMKKARILMLGLDSSGKTTILYKLKLGEVVSTIPTIGLNVDKIDYKNVRFAIWEIGGRDKIRPLWRHYYQNTQGLIFVINSADRERIGECRYELQKLLSSDQLYGTALLIFANKQDLPEAMSIAEMSDMLGLNNLRFRKWHIQASSVVNERTLYDGLDWLVQRMNEKN